MNDLNCHPHSPHSANLRLCSEAMLLGKNLGLAPQILADTINSSTGRCWSSEVSPTSPISAKLNGNTKAFPSVYLADHMSYALE